MQKVKLLTSVLVLGVMMLNISCGGGEEHDDVLDGPVVQRVKFDMAGVMESYSKVLKEDITSVRLSIETLEGGAILTDEVITINSLGDDYLSTSVKLANGSYILTSFTVLNSEGATRYAAPRQGSDKAFLTSKSLPLRFDVTREKPVVIIPEVAPIATTDLPEQFGYQSFGLELAETFTYNYQIRSDYDGRLVNCLIKVYGYEGENVVFYKEDYYKGEETSVGHIELYSELSSYVVVIEHPDYFNLRHSYLTTKLIKRKKQLAPHADEDIVPLYLSSKKYTRGFYHSPTGAQDTRNMIFAFAPIDPCEKFLRIDFAGFEHQAKTTLTIAYYLDGGLSYPWDLPEYDWDNIPGTEVVVLENEKAPRGNYFITPALLSASESLCDTEGEPVERLLYVVTLDYDIGGGQGAGTYRIILEWNPLDETGFVFPVGKEYYNPYYGGIGSFINESNINSVTDNRDMLERKPKRN